MSEPATFAVGDGATVCYWSDRQAGTIVEASERRVVWQRDNARRTDDRGMSDAQDYAYEPDPQGKRSIFTLRRNGRWVRQGEPQRNGTRLARGRHEHYDYTF